MMFNKFLLFALVLTIGLSFSSCGDDDPDIPVEPEVITTLTYTLTPSGGGADVVLSFVDLDGDGGDAPSVVGGSLAANETYSGTIVLLNESVSPSDNITEEVAAEDEEHQFFFRSSIDDLSIAYNDADENGNPLGLSNTLTTGAAGSGSITVILLHEPSKDADGVSDGDITNAGGETDIEVTFSIDVQ